jgi:hypothetical protein
MFKRIHVAAIMLTAACFSNAQESPSTKPKSAAPASTGAISGRVIDAVEGIPLGDASVQSSTGGSSVTTDDSGNSLLSGYKSNRFNWLAKSSKSFRESGG